MVSEFDKYDEERIERIVIGLKKYNNSELDAFAKGYAQSSRGIDSLRTLEALKRIGREDLVDRIEKETSLSPETKRLLEQARG